jgi:exopolyphosphatase/guanosine-5'-triphosphate,3'-diphosphate pyrophosphatase
MKLRAGIDIGTNTILLLIAKVSCSQIEVLEDHVTVVRLGQGVDKSKAFHPEALDRARACFLKYRKILDRYPGIEINAIATSGSRDAKNSPQFFQEILEKFQIPVRVISGEEEAQLSFKGAVADGAEEGVAVLDIGGGSSEIVGKEGGNLFRFSFDMGCVRLSERFFQHDPALPTEIEALKKFVELELAKQEDILAKVRGRKLIGVAGTATYLASSHLGLEKFLPEKVDRTWVGVSDVENLIQKFTPLTAAQRLGMGGMDKGRADVILAGAFILLAILKKAELKGFEASVRGLRYGAVLN